MNTHAIIAISTDGRRLELGRMGSLERAVRLGQRLADELGDEYTRFEYLELNATREFHEIIAATWIRGREEDRAAKARAELG